jgi:LuxR family maltose regulon positive regulatory protein
VATTVLLTKLFIPKARRDLVPRQRLTDRLNDGLRHGFVLVAAPAGFGKTTLLSEWVEKTERPCAWLSLDEGDSEPATFLTYLVAALQRVAPTVGQQWAHALDSSQPVESVLVALLNELSAVPEPVVLVLDDYHRVDATEVDAAVSFLLDHMPPQLQLVIATRQDPDLPLARLRARGELAELRAADLRFSAPEAADYLNSVMELNLSAADIATLDSRTEGWIAGLQLAALSMRGHDDVASFISAFAGDHRYIADYLVGEVLARQPEDVRSFLLETAVLERMTGPLCDAVTGDDNGSARLDALERSNFFVVPLDDTRQWYRYHHLFADVLRAFLAEERPGSIPELHRRAAGWHESIGSLGDAIRHSLAAGDYANAASLVERAAPAMQRTRQESTVLGWLRSLPDEVLHSRPVLSAVYGSTLLATGETEGVEDRLRDAERWLDSTTGTTVRPGDSSEMVVVDDEAFRRLPASIAVWRAGLALATGRPTETVTHARRALELAGDDHLTRGAATALIGLTSLADGDLETAYEMYAESVSRLQSIGNISDVLGCSITLADIRFTQGRLGDAMRIYERGLQLAAQYGSPTLRGAADMHVGLGEVHRERGDVNAAMEHLITAHELGESAGLPQNPYRWRVAMARIRQVEGDLDSAVTLLDEAERVFSNDFNPIVRPVAATRTRLWVAQGRLGAAVDWAREHGLSVRDDLSYLREYEHITLARVLLAQHRSDPADHNSLVEAMGLLGRLLNATEEGSRTGHTIEVLLLQALAHHAHGDIAAATVPLRRALTLAEPEGYVRVFADEAAPMAALLQAAAAHRLAGSYGRRLLSAVGTASDRISQPDLIEALSERELDVLRLLGSDLGGPEIARQLVVSLNTVRTHTKHIYAKLGVNSRRAAVRRAMELDLLARDRSRA